LNGGDPLQQLVDNGRNIDRSLFLTAAIFASKPTVSTSSFRRQRPLPPQLLARLARTRYRVTREIPKMLELVELMLHGRTVCILREMEKFRGKTI
jgi:hypothetical protein